MAKTVTNSPQNTFRSFPLAEAALSGSIIIKPRKERYVPYDFRSNPLHWESRKKTKKTCVFLYQQNQAAPITRVFWAVTWRGNLICQCRTGIEQSRLIQGSVWKMTLLFSPLFFNIFALLQLYFHLWELPTGVTAFFSPPYFHWPFEQLLEGLMPCLRASEHQWG